MRSWIPRYLILPLRFVNFDNLVSLLVTVWSGAVGRVPQVPQWELGVDPARAADILRSFPKGNGVNHSNRNFRFSYLNGTYPFSRDVPGSSAPFPLAFICFSVVVSAD